jgi:hypothetical protein
MSLSKLSGRKATILDWDDTLFSSDHYTKNKAQYKRVLPYIRHPEKKGKFAAQELSKKDYQLYQELKSLDQFVFTFVNQLEEIGSVYLVTNGSSSWFWKESVLYFPLLQAFFKSRKHLFYSARDNYESKFPNDVTKWKKHQFEDIVHKDLKQPNAKTMKAEIDLTCISDQKHDLDNCRHIYKEFKMARISEYELEKKLAPSKLEAELQDVAKQMKV